MTWLLLLTARRLTLSSSGPTPRDVAAQRLASAYGPSLAECSEFPKDGKCYGPTVLKRSQTKPPGDWDQRVLLYSQGLLRSPWTKSFPRFREYEPLSGPPFDGRPRNADATIRPQKFNCLVNVVFGLQDIALDPRIVLDGIEECLLSESDEAATDAALKRERVVRLPTCGHWSLLEDAGIEALDRILHDILTKRTTS